MKQLKYFLVALAALATIGCGSSSNDYVYSGNVNPALTGDVTFQFTQAATQALVPAGTTFLNFDFYSEVDADGNPVPPVDFSSHDVPYASSVTVEDVPVAASYVVITAYGDHGIPLATAETPITVYGGQNTNADMTDVPVVSVSATSVTAAPVSVSVGADADPVVTAMFDNGDSVALHSSLFTVAGNNVTVATYAATTGFTGVAAGSTTYTATFGSITSAAANVTVGTVTPPASLTLAPTGVKVMRTYDDVYTIRQVMDKFGISGKVGNVDVTASLGYGSTLGGSNPGSFGIDSDDSFRVSAGAAEGDSCTIPVHVNYNDSVLNASFNVLAGPVAWVSPNAASVNVSSTFTFGSASFHAYNIDGTARSGSVDLAGLKGVSGFSDVTLVSSASWLTVDNTGTGSFTVAAGTPVGIVGYVWLMQGAYILDAVKVTTTTPTP